MTACTSVAAPAATASGISRSARCFPMTSSIRYLEVAGSTRPESRLTSISARPSAKPAAARPDQRFAPPSTPPTVSFFLLRRVLSPAAAQPRRRRAAACPRAPSDFGSRSPIPIAIDYVRRLSESLETRTPDANDLSRLRAPKRDAACGALAERTLDRLRHAGLVVRAGDRPAPRLQLGQRVPHQHRGAGELEHLQVVQIVSHRHDLGAREARGAPPSAASAEPFEQPARTTSTSEKSRCAYSVSATENVAGARRARSSNSVAHLGAAAGEHHLDRIFGQARPRAATPRQEGRLDVEETARAGDGPSRSLRRRPGPRAGGRRRRRRCRDAAGRARARRARRRAAADRASASRPSCVFTIAPLLRMSVSGAGSCSKIGRAKSYRRPVASDDFDSRHRSRGRSPRDWPPGPGRGCRESCRRCRAQGDGSSCRTGGRSAERAAEPLTSPAHPSSLEI